MRKLMKRVAFCAAVAALIWLCALIADRKTLHEELIRFHVVANSDSQEDQAVKRHVRDAVLSSIQKDLQSVKDIDAARAYLRENLPKIRETANRALKEAGFDCEAVVSLCEEAFDTRFYDTFTLPAGVYEALRITIGEGRGQNWWCVAFPNLCLPETAEAFADSAADAGFSRSLTDALSHRETYQIRFFLLDALGRLENKLFPG